MTEKEYIEQLRNKASIPGAKASMSDEELLALLLSNTNCKDRLRHVVNGLVSHFGTVKLCFSARLSELMAVDGMTRNAAVLIMLVGKAASTRDKKPAHGECTGDFGRMFLAVLKPSREEELWAAALDKRDMFIGVERLALGTQVEVGINLGAVIAFAGRYGSRRIVIAHSHPDACEPELSERDMLSMIHIAHTLDELGITLLGQVVIAKEKAKFFECNSEKFSRE